MKNYFLVFLIALAGCSSVKENASAQDGKQLIKDIETLSSDAYEGRKTGTKGAEMARNYIIGRFNSFGLKPYPGKQHIMDFTFKRRNAEEIAGKNVVGYIKGKTDSVIVLSAHYDHLGVVNGQIFNGADDNASGVGALLYFAEYFSKNKPNHSMIFAAFDAEEMGLQGAHAFVANPPVGLEMIKLNINMDMVGRNEKNELYAAGTFKYPELKPYIKTTVQGINLLLGHDDPKMGSNDWTNQSDQGAFNRKGIPFIYFGVEDHPDYHKETDEFKNIKPDFYLNATKAILEVIKNVDKAISLKQVTLKSKLIMDKP